MQPTFPTSNGHAKLTDALLIEGVRVLAGQDPDLADVFTAFGPPPLWAKREPDSYPDLYYSRTASLAGLSPSGFQPLSAGN